MKTENSQYEPKLLEKWASTQLNCSQNSFSNSYIISPKIAVLMAFLVGFIFSIPFVYIDNAFPTKIELFSDIFYQKWSLILVVAIASSAIESYFIFRINIMLAHSMVKKYGYDIESLKSCYILGFDFLLSRFVVGLDEPKIDIFGIEMSKQRNSKWIIVKKFLFRLRITLSNAITKFLIRKILVQNSIRVSIEWVSAVVIGFWNAVSVFMFYAKVKKLLEKMKKVDLFLEENSNLNAQDQILYFYIVGNIFIHTGENRPSLQYLIFKLQDMYKLDLNKHDIDNVELLREKLSEANSLVQYKEFFSFCTEVAGVKVKQSQEMEQLFFN